MKIGIVIAIAREIKAFLDSNYTIETIQEDYREVYKTTINNNEVYIIQSGYGIVDASAATQYLITKYKVEAILNYGVTGALEESLRVDDLFVVRRTVNYAYDVSPIDPVKPGQYEEFEDEFMYLDDGLIQFAKSICPELKEATDATGDCFVEDPAMKKKLHEVFKGDICDMEIAAITRTAFKNHVKVLSIKCISDTLNGDGGDFNTNVTRSAQKAFSLMSKILDSIS